MDGRYDMIVCGGGTAGVAAAVTAARNGAEVLLIERGSCLGGVLTQGNVSYIMDLNGKQGFALEVVERLISVGAAKEVAAHVDLDPEMAKYVLEDMCLEAGVRLLYYTEIVGVEKDKSSVEGIRTYSKSGFQTYSADIFIDCTGDGDVCAMAGCEFDMGDEENGICQPMSFVSIVGGVKLEDIREYCIHVPDVPYSDAPKLKTWELLSSLGIKLSYTMPFFMPIPGETDRFVFACNHEYHKNGVSAEELTSATLEGRREAFESVRALKRLGGIWKNIKVISTPSYIGVRESRRIHGKYKVTKEDLIEGKSWPNPACHVTFNVDIHFAGGYKNGEVAVKNQGYDIPMEALMAEGFDNLFMAGRCISGDFYAHASYRVMGNTLMMGEGIGRYCARLLAQRG